MVDPGVALILFGLVASSVAVVLWPRRGVAARLMTMARLTERVRLEDTVKHVYQYQLQGRKCTLESLAGQVEVSTERAARILERLTAVGLIHAEGEELVLTEDGQQSALRVLRSHRLWEQYLAERTGLPAGEWHDRAERMEHALTPEETDVLASRLGHPTYDPHGDPIPTATGALPPLIGVTLFGVDVGQTVEIVHLEDEPREVYEDLERQGLTLRRRLEVVGRSDTAVRVRAGGEVLTLGPVAARNVTVRALSPHEPVDQVHDTLADLTGSETGRVIGISSACQGPQRRRLLDLGVVAGTEITPELVSSAGDPVAYRIRGALIALRKSQASLIEVERVAGLGHS